VSPRLFLFDVDGTLVTARGAGRLAFARALESTFGTAGALERYDFRGKTDPRIVWDLMREAGVPDARIAERIEACFTAYVQELAALIGDGHRVQVMPGVADLIPALAARAHAIVGLLTGNIEAGARAKLGPTGLLPLFRVGAFGSDDADRTRLPAIAARRAEAAVGRVFRGRDVVIIGDTPRDIGCARAFGATAIAVATGRHGTGELLACAPDCVFPDLGETQRVTQRQHLHGDADLDPSRPGREGRGHDEW